jgi:hypothetical protein
MVRAVRLDEIAPVRATEEDALWRPIRHHFGVRAFGVNAWVGPRKGDEVIEDHREIEGGAAGHEELYLVLRGRAAFTVDDDEAEVDTGTLVHVPDPGARRRAVALEPDTIVLAIGAPPGAAFAVSPWERRHFPDTA